MTGIWERPPARFFARSSETKLARLFVHYGWTQTVDPNEADVLLLGSSRHLQTHAVRPDQLVDAVAGSSTLTHKGRLARLLRQDPRTKTFQPPTFLIDDDPSEVAALRHAAASEPGTVWLRKPQSRGRGIGVEPIEDIEAFLDGRTDARPHGRELVQRYIDNPLLLEGTKSEVRSYILIACTDPLLVLYHDGTVRLSSLPFERGDWSNPLRHVTNTYRQKKASPQLWADQGETRKWTLGELGRDVLDRGLTQDPQWVDHALRPALIGLLHVVFEAARSALTDRAREFPGSFALLGMDTILTDDLDKVWLTEIQLGPGLSIDNPVKAQLIPSMLREAMSIVFEVRDRLAAGTDPTRLHSRRYFRWVVSGTRSG